MEEKECKQKKEPLMQMQWHFRSISEALFIHAVVLPELEEVLVKYGLINRENVYGGDILHE